MRKKEEVCSRSTAVLSNGRTLKLEVAYLTWKLQHEALKPQTNTTITAAEWESGAPVQAGEHKGKIPRCQAMEKGITFFLQHAVKTSPKLLCLEISLLLTSKGLLPCKFLRTRHPSFSPKNILPLVQVFGVLTTLALRSSMSEQIQIIIILKVLSGVHTSPSHQPPPSHITKKHFPPLYEGVREACCSTSF